MPISRLSASLILAAASVVVVAPAFAHPGHSHITEVLTAAYEAEPLVAGAAPPMAVMEEMVVRAAQTPGEVGPFVLPPFTTLDSVTWDDAILDVRLTIHAPVDDFVISPIDAYGLSAAFAAPFMEDGAFGGVRLLVRAGVDGAYGSLEPFIADAGGHVFDAEDIGPQEIALTLEQATPKGADPAKFGGPASHGARQPQGALSGVTVYVSAGHGWTFTGSGWGLQRPLLLDMNEDYGNIDQINYFAHFLFNAGATVVPLRPVGWQPIEITIDHDDPEVTYTGAWSNGASSKYYENNRTLSGEVYRFVSAASVETATARYSANIPESGFYPVYCFTIASSNRTLQTYRVGHSGGVTEVVVDHREVGNGWVWLGEYYLEAGGDNYVEITNLSTESGVIIADGMRWGCGVGDIDRGTGVSSFTRDEEAQRYWGQSEWGDNAVGFPSDLWDVAGLSDNSDNVRTGARLAREMNVVPAGGVQADRWKRVHLEFHTNASGGGARGQLTLITTLTPTTNQVAYANILSDEIDNDMLVLSNELEHLWVDRSSATFTSGYGAISASSTGNQNEFDATIVELAFHDNQQDAELLRDPKVRRAMARACVHGIIRFLDTLPGNQIPLAFAPDTPRNFRIEDLGGGDIQLSWTTPLADDARGDAATGYVVYESSNGFGFGNPQTTSNLSLTISNVPVGETRYYRVAATNAGGESMSTETLAIRRPDTGTADILIVNGFDRMDRFITPVQTLPGGSTQRQIWRQTNAYNYAVEHAEALAASGYGFVSTSNEAIELSLIDLDDYHIVVWILGTESTADDTFSANEQNKVTDFLQGGGSLFVSGSEIAWDLVQQAGGASFAQNLLRIGYAGDDANTFNVSPAAGSILDGVSSFNFNPQLGAPYDVRTPDRLAPGADATACLNYVGGSGGVAGVQLTLGVYNVVVFGFPFETITDAGARADVMGRIIAFLETAEGPRLFDYNSDFAVNYDDFRQLEFCTRGPDVTFPAGTICVDVFGEEDLDIDLEDYSVIQVSANANP